MNSPNKETKDQRHKSILKCRNIVKSFGGVNALRGVNIEFKDSCVTALIGPNGAGKTTLLNILSGFMRPDQGQCFMNGIEITRLHPRKIVSLGIVRTFQEVRLLRQVSVLDNVLIAFQNQPGESLWRVVMSLGINKAERQNLEIGFELLEAVGLSDKSAKRGYELSYGEQKLLSLARCMAMDAEILLLDEPVAGVHPQKASEILQLLRKLAQSGKMIIFVEHNIAAVREIAERLLVMDEGRVIADGIPEEVLKQPEIVEAYVA